MPVVAVVLAAGFGTRFDENNPKQLVSVGGKPIVCWKHRGIRKHDRISDIIVVVNERVEETVNELIDEAGYAKVRAIVPGGAERVDSTLAALDLLKQAGIPSGAKILIHDGRASVRRGAVHRRLHRQPGPVQRRHRGLRLHRHDSAHRGSGRSQGGQTVPERPNTFRAQTPQAFRFGTIVKAYELAAADPDFHPTDDTRVVVDYLPDEPVAIVDGSETNLKITTPSDMPIAEGIARSLDPEHAKEEAKARMHAVFAEAFSQMHSR